MNTRSAFSKMKPLALTSSKLLQRTAPRIQSILSGYSQTPQKQDDDAFSPYFRGIPSVDKSTTSSSKATMRPLISEQEIKEWQTSHMPLLTDKQLEMALLEIRRRKKRHRRKQSDSSIGASTNQSVETKGEAAILVPLCTVNGIPSVLFTRRSDKLSSHASQISFPGGYHDKYLDTLPQTTNSYSNILGTNTNLHLANTALREMQEELSFSIPQILTLQKAHNLPFVSILGQTQPVPSMTGNRVTPIVGQINYNLPHHTTNEFHAIFPGNKDELDWIFTVPISDLLQYETVEPLRKWGDFDLEKKKRNEYWGPVFPVPEGREKREDDRIWGLTASVLRPLLHRVFRGCFVDEVEDVGSRL